MPRFHSYCLPFQSEGNYAFVNIAVRWNKFQLLQACLRGKSSTFWKWHCLRIIALESKRLIHTLWTWCRITWKRIFYPIQQKSMVFNQECRWNNGSKSLHSFWPPRIDVKNALSGMYTCISSVESQKGVITDQQCSIENQKGSIVEVLWYIGLNPWLWIKGFRVRFPWMPGTFCPSARHFIHIAALHPGV